MEAYKDLIIVVVYCDGRDLLVRFWWVQQFIIEIVKDADIGPEDLAKDLESLLENVKDVLVRWELLHVY